MAKRVWRISVFNILYECLHTERPSYYLFHMNRLKSHFNNLFKTKIGIFSPKKVKWKREGYNSNGDSSVSLHRAFADVFFLFFIFRAWSRGTFRQGTRIPINYFIPKLTFSCEELPVNQEIILTENNPITKRTPLPPSIQESIFFLFLAGSYLGYTGCHFYMITRTSLLCLYSTTFSFMNPALRNTSLRSLLYFSNILIKKLFSIVVII